MHRALEHISFLAQGLQPQIGQRVKLLLLTARSDLAIERAYLIARHPNGSGVITGSYPNHEGQAWFVEHEDGTVAVYVAEEMAPDGE
jgi:hypothetical protein